MEWNFICANDYVEICDWWRDWDFPIVHPDFLPPLGVIISNNGVKTYASWLYLTGTKIGLMEFIVSNKKAPICYKRGGLEYMTEVISSIAKKEGVEKIFHYTNEPMVEKRLLKSGFSVGDEETKTYIKTI